MNEAYEVDKDTKVMVAIKLLAAYRTIIPCNLLGLLEVRDVYYEPMYIVIKRINCIVIPLPLHHIYITTMNVAHVTENTSQDKIMYRISVRLFRPIIRSCVTFT